MSDGALHLGITVTDSCFHRSGQTLVVVILLYIAASVTASKSANLVTSSGKISPLNIDFGFLNFFKRIATSWTARSGKVPVCVVGRSDLCRGRNS